MVPSCGMVGGDKKNPAEHPGRTPAGTAGLEERPDRTRVLTGAGCGPGSRLAGATLVHWRQWRREIGVAGRQAWWASAGVTGVGACWVAEAQLALLRQAPLRTAAQDPPCCWPSAQEGNAWREPGGRMAQPLCHPRGHSPPWTGGLGFCWRAFSFGRSCLGLVDPLCGQVMASAQEGGWLRPGLCPPAQWAPVADAKEQGGD